MKKSVTVYSVITKCMKASLSNVTNAQSGIALHAQISQPRNSKTSRTKSMCARSASEKFIFTLKMLDKYSFNRFEAVAEKLMRETRDSLGGSKSDRLIDNRVRGFFLAILD